MLAAHRDQENVVHGHPVPSRQQPKTPGARYPKTPSRFTQRDENAPTAFGTKVGLGGTKPQGTRQTLMTPLGQSRAVLGNKTTNAKARTGGHAGGVKDIVKELEKTQAKQTTVQKSRQRAADVAPVKFQVRLDQPETLEEEEEIDEEEPEYAPPPVASRPYESDVLPRGLTFEGLKKENLLRGYYDYYHDPTDENGVSRNDKKLEDEMERLVQRAGERNQRDMRDLDWTVRKDEPADAKPTVPRPTVRKVTPATSNRWHNPPTMTSKRAAAALSQPSTRSKPPSKAPVAAPRRPLNGLIRGNRTPNQPVAEAREQGNGAPGEIASRTTLGYNKGKSASSLVRARKQQAAGSSGPSKAFENSTVVNRAKVTSSKPPAPAASPAREQPEFLSIFAVDGDDDEDLPAQIMPQSLLAGTEDDDDDDVVELRMNI